MGRWVDSLEAAAADRLPEPVFRYLRQGARDGVSAAEAAAAWDAVRLVPRVLRDVNRVEMSRELLGARLAAPLAVAPTTMQRALHDGGEVAMAEGVAAAGGLLCVSSNAGSRFADIAATGVTWWMQMYVTRDRVLCRDVVEAAVSEGARAVVLTVDTPVVGAKYDDGPTIWDSALPEWLRVNFAPGPPDAAGAEKARDLGPEDVAWLAETSRLPVVVKGVLHPEDAAVCRQAGAAAVWVSNHGGRQLDQVVPTATALPGVAAAVGGRAPVYVDGGLRRAPHLAAALALGADAVFLGRLPLYALAVGGADGVRRLLIELADDLEETLALLGCASVETLPGSGVVAGFAGSPAESNHTDVLPPGVDHPQEAGQEPDSRG